jgi:hypothetical protein
MISGNKGKWRYIMRSLNSQVARIIIAILVVVASLGMTTPPAAAQEISTTSDLTIRLLWAPRHAKACETFKVVYLISNRGPDPATDVNVQIGIPDPFSVITVVGVPTNLSARKSEIVVVTLKVVAFVPGEARNWWITGSVSSDPYPNISVDPKPANNEVTKPIKLLGKHVQVCP